MISDNIDIRDAKIINVGFNYEYVVNKVYDRVSVMNEVQEKLQILFESYFIKTFVGLENSNSLFFSNSFL